MAAYVTFEMTELADAAAFDDYRKRVPAVVAQYDGKYVVRGGKIEMLEGGWSPKRLVIIEFPSIERALEWYRSPEYAPLKALRQRGARANIIVAEGV